MSYTSIAPPTYQQATSQEYRRLNYDSSNPVNSLANNSRIDIANQTINNRGVTLQQTNNQARDMPKPTLLSSGAIVNNDTNNTNFVEDLLAMSPEDILKLQSQIQNNRNEYPMPCMQITAFQLRLCLDNALEIYNLTKKEKQILIEIINELNSLSPNYPYNKSLTITYKILTVLSFLECRFKCLDINMSAKKLNKLDIAKHFQSEGKGRYIKSINLMGEITNDFKSSCSLFHIQNLPWDKMQENSDEFEKSINTIYASSVFSLENDGYFNQCSDSLGSIDVINTLRSGMVLIPYTGNLTLSELNKFQALPINLINCSTESFLKNKLTIDIYSDYYSKVFLMPNSFFEKNLRIAYYKEEIFIDKIQISVFVNELYKNKEIIDSRFSNFNAIEIALFICFNEIITLNKNDLYTIEERLTQMSQEKHTVSHAVFPKEYANIRGIDIKNAAWLLFKLKTYLADQSFNTALELIENDIASGKREQAVTKAIWKKNDDQQLNTDKYDPVEERQKIAINVRKNQKQLLKIGVNPSTIVNLLFELDYNRYSYIREAIPRFFSDFQTPFATKERKWLQCYRNYRTMYGDDTEQAIKETCKKFKKT